MSNQAAKEFFQGFLREKEAEYLRAKEYAKSETHANIQAAAYLKIKSIVPQSSTPDQAMFILGRILQLIEGVSEATAIIIQYESAKKSLDEIIAVEKSR